MEFFKRLNVGGVSLLKLVGIVLFGLVVAAFVLSILSSSFNLARDNRGYSVGNSMPMAPSYDYAEEAAYMPTLSVRNTMYPPEPGNNYATGDDAEAYEVKEYSARIETRDLSRDCDAVRALKSRNDIIFERADTYTTSCSFSFKVKRGSVEDVLAIIETLDPRELNESAYTIKREITDYTSEIQILENKLASYDRTLADALASYENITALATATGNADALAKVIESKVGIIERLTSLRVSTVAELDRMNRAKAEALDRLEYTYFSVTVYENKYIDGITLKDSWKAAVKKFVTETNRLLQDLSIGVVSFLLTLIKFALYFVIIVFAVRLGWAYVQRLWQNPPTAGMQ